MPEGAADALPSRSILFSGNIILLSPPASAMGGSRAAFTVTVTVTVAVAPLLSVTFNSNVYSPSVRLFTAVVAAPASAIVPAAGPEILVHANDTIVPEGAVEVVPSRVMLF